MQNPHKIAHTFCVDVTLNLFAFTNKTFDLNNKINSVNVRKAYNVND